MDGRQRAAIGLRCSSACRMARRGSLARVGIRGWAPGCPRRNLPQRGVRAMRGAFPTGLGRCPEWAAPPARAEAVQEPSPPCQRLRLLPHQARAETTNIIADARFPRGTGRLPGWVPSWLVDWLDGWLGGYQKAAKMQPLSSKCGTKCDPFVKNRCHNASLIALLHHLGAFLVPKIAPLSMK